MPPISLSTCIQAPEGALKPIVAEVVETVDSLHGVTGLPQVSITYTEYFRPFARYHPNDGAPLIELSNRGPHPRLSLAPEIGHLLDHALGGFYEYASEKRRLALYRAIQQIERSRAVRTLQRASRSKAPLEPGADARQIDYWLQPPELWARAYAQYVAVRANNREMLIDLQVSIDLEDIGLYKNVQWDSTDFEPIAATIDTVLEELEWQI
jgi:hypothetical protein